MFDSFSATQINRQYNPVHFRVIGCQTLANQPILIPIWPTRPVQPRGTLRLKYWRILYVLHRWRRCACAVMSRFAVTRNIKTRRWVKFWQSLLFYRVITHSHVGCLSPQTGYIVLRQQKRVTLRSNLLHDLPENVLWWRERRILHQTYVPGKALEKYPDQWMVALPVHWFSTPWP